MPCPQSKLLFSDSRALQNVIFFLRKPALCILLLIYYAVHLSAQKKKGYWLLYSQKCKLWSARGRGRCIHCSSQIRHFIRRPRPCLHRQNRTRSFQAAPSRSSRRSSATSSSRFGPRHQSDTAQTTAFASSRELYRQGGPVLAPSSHVHGCEGARGNKPSILMPMPRQPTRAHPSSMPPFTHSPPMQSSCTPSSWCRSASQVGEGGDALDASCLIVPHAREDEGWQVPRTRHRQRCNDHSSRRDDVSTRSTMHGRKAQRDEGLLRFKRLTLGLCA